MPSDGEHHLIGRDARSVRQVRREGLAMLFDLGDDAAGQHRNAGLLHFAAHMSAHIVVEAAQDILTAIDHRHIGTKPGEDAGEFQRDVAAALNHNPLRNLGR